MDAAKSFFVHLGAHRTGTSSFQMMLAQNADVLRAAGYDLAYPGRDDIPGGTLGLRLPSPRNIDQWQSRFKPAVARELERHSDPGRAALILSEENIFGRMIHFPSGRFYPAAEARLRTLAAGAGVPVRRAVLVVRSYADLYISAWRKRAEDNPTPPFAKGRRNMLNMDRGWPELAEIVLTELFVQELIVVDYARRGTSVDLLSLLVPATRDLPLQEPDRIMNLSATDAALQDLQARYAGGETLARKEWQEILRTHSEDKGPLGLSEFTARQRRILDGRYAEDLDRLGQMPGVLLLR